MWLSTSPSSSEFGDRSSVPIALSSAPTSPPPTDGPNYPDKMDVDTDGDAVADEQLQVEEAKARKVNNAREARRATTLRRKKTKPVSQAELEAKARELDDLLMKTAAFSKILTNKTRVLGRVGSSLDGKALGEHELVMAKQPKCLVGGTMRDYQLEGLTWMYEICSQGMSGILADEMGLGKTIQTISLIALLREKENYLGPHLIVAPLSTLANWIAEFQKWCPSVPVIMYHGTIKEREAIRRTSLFPNLIGGRPTTDFPVVCTSYEMVLIDRAHLSRINWEFIIVDEGHRLKNSDAKLYRELCQFQSATRLLITGTPLQNNLKELWSLLHFLLPGVFTDWDAFETWFDFSDLQDEQGTTEFIQDDMKKGLISKIHLILQPLLLRRVKADVAEYLPKKREYVLYAPMTKEQTDLYNVITDKDVDTRAYLESKVVERLRGTTKSPAGKIKAMPLASRLASISLKPHSESGNDEVSHGGRGRSPKRLKLDPSAVISPDKNAFSIMMPRKRGRPLKNAASPAPATALSTPVKRKEPPTMSESAVLKRARSTRSSTPLSNGQGRPRRAKRHLKFDESDDEKLSDDEFEAKLVQQYGKGNEKTSMSPESMRRSATLQLAKKEISAKKLGNQMMQLRLVCNSPHMFYNPWADGSDADETIVTSSGKMLLLDRLLPALFERGHKVLIFSQFALQLNILQDYCHLRNWNFCLIDGTTHQSDRQAQIQDFNTDPDYKIFLLTTRAGGQGINLVAADTVILFDSDWNPQQDLQAQDRCHRIGQTRPVIIYRLATKDTVEESLLMSADAKRRLEKLVIKKGSFRTMGRGRGSQDDDLDGETLRSLLLKDGQVYKFSGDKEILSDHDLDILCDRSDEAYARAAQGSGNADGYRVVETGANGITTT